jgi:ABC-type branched-subunit amino acid transport system substrate-binding protein
VLFALVTIALAVGAASCGGSNEEAAPPAEPPAEPATPPAEPAPAESGATGETEAPAEPTTATCPADDGSIDMYASSDAESGTIGQAISPDTYDRMAGIWIDKTNAEGGILGCKVTFTVEENGFVDIDICVRQYKQAIQSGKYDFFIGPTNSGCMAALPDLTGAAGKWLFSGIAADHQPFFSDCSQPMCFKAPYYVAMPSVSTFLEGRTAAFFAVQQGWKAPATMVPNYAYGQDVDRAFTQYYEANSGGTKVVAHQFPEVTETEFTPFLNAILAKNPDGIVTAFFSAGILPIMQQWLALGKDSEIPVISGLFSVDAQIGVKAADQIPENWYGYDRGNTAVLEKNPVAKEYLDLFLEKYGAERPYPDAFPFQVLSTLQMAKALIEKTGGLDPEAWKAAIEAGDFTFDGPYNAGPTPVNPINHMADTCAEVGKVVWDDANQKAAYDPATFVLGCMHDVLPIEEAKQLTDNPAVTDEAIAKYQELSGNK